MPFLEGFVSSYLNPLEAKADFASLPSRFPALCVLDELAYESHGYFGAETSAHGRHKMHVLTITSDKGTRPKPAVLLMRSPHAREWINAVAVVEAAHQLLENYRPSDPDPRVQQVVEMLDKAEILIVPEGNPDGALYSFFDPGQRMWRKNLRALPAGTTCAGVDCNRNYSRYFGEPGSSSAPCSEVYHGPSPFSEPEVANIANLAQARQNILFAIDSHSYGEAIFRPTPNGGTYIGSMPISPADDAIYTQLESEMNARISIVNGTTYSTGSTSNHAGTSDEYLFFDQQIFSFDLECGTDFQPAWADALVAAKEVVAATMALGWCAAGNTSVDVNALLARRASLDVHAPLHYTAVKESWAPVRLPPERWRRFISTCEVPDVQRRMRFLADLHERGFDVTSDHPDSTTVDVVLSAEELVALLRESVTVSVRSDVYAESVAIP